MKAHVASERRGLAMSKSSPQHSLSHSDAGLAQSDASSTRSTKSASATSSHDKLKDDTSRVSVDVKSERSSSRASDHYSEEFDEPSVASGRENLDVAVSQPTKAKKSPPS